MNASFRALVVEDDVIAREATVLALQDEGFVCAFACDGTEAAVAMNHSTFDVVVTDLRMPKRHGHSLAVEITGRGMDRPLVVVLTGVLEPRLLKDLIAHEVDDIAFKPIDLNLFAAKVRALCTRRLRHNQTVGQIRGNNEPNNVSTAAGNSSQRGELCPVSQEEIEHRFCNLARIPTVSKTAIDVFKLTTKLDTSCQQVAAAVQLEPALIADVLRLANSSFFNPSSQKFTAVEPAVIRLGQKRVGELALTTATFSAATQAKVPFFSLERVWKKCLATGICLEMLAEESAGGVSSAGMFCAAVLQPIGRILLASAFPELYEQMLKQSVVEFKSLSELEARVFPQSPGELTSSTLESWGIPDSVHRPLRYIDLPFGALSSIGEPLRRRVELIKTAVFLGEVVAAEYEDWDFIDIPSAAMLNRFGIKSVDATIEQCRDDLKQMASFSGVPKSDVSGPSECSSLPPIAYKRLQNDSVDFIRHILEATGRAVSEIAFEVPDQDDVVVNAIGAATHQVIRCVRRPRIHAPIILSDPENAKRLEDYGKVISLPCTWSRLHGMLVDRPVVAV